MYTYIYIYMYIHIYIYTYIYIERERERYAQCPASQSPRTAPASLDDKKCRAGARAWAGQADCW